MVSSGDPQPLKVSAAAVNSNGPPLPVPRAAQPVPSPNQDASWSHFPKACGVLHSRRQWNLRL